MLATTTHEELGVPDVSICVAVYREHGAPNLNTLSASLADAVGTRSFELVAALNGIDAIHAGVPVWARTVEFETNQGVPKAWNAAARLSRGRLVCVVNDDVELGKESLNVLATALDAHPDAGVVGPVGTRWDVDRAQHIEYVDTTGQPRGTLTSCEVLSGFLMMTPRVTFDAAGGFDEAFTPCGFEEVDYCTAVRRRLGLNAYAVAGVEVEHEFAISARRGWRRIRYDGRSERLGDVADRNRAYFLQKWTAR